MLQSDEQLGNEKNSYILDEKSRWYSLQVYVAVFLEFWNKDFTTEISTFLCIRNHSQNSGFAIYQFTEYLFPPWGAHLLRYETPNAVMHSCNIIPNLDTTCVFHLHSIPVFCRPIL